MAEFKKYPKFNAEEDKDKIVAFLKDWFAQNGPTANAVIGISGGKDSSVAAALCVEALGKDRVIGVLMPNGVQSDIDDALKLVNHLGIKYRIVNIGAPYKEMLKALQYTEAPSNNNFHFAVTDALRQNLPPRLRMAALYAVAQGLKEGGRVLNTCNLSEDYVGYATKFGDGAGDVAPLAAYTVTEIRAIGDLLALPAELVHKAPSDGLCGKTDEDNLGFTYAVLDQYIMTGECEDEAVKANIDRRHAINKHKLELMPVVNR
ncbi:putative NH(3)-dependent NAD(+) synthetase (plasmid) [Selenomonas ruminantium subsp. lactilytica TAM6421]|uniref:NH(3)-dependent NAD(+) synthetase n=1 Tax=Selenomonas ruminantium subsp. lactilytica (strain NBRC 103574 / TAM6421) TaxID=927704 RepID=I0GW13_SELRL|nr:NAD(+) synthase [Selenomonas ruminantium]BAL84950.1 putative NH(3)-dependent NAD(+) synthetase [Selenomonas ruminantium subsp. lactilytica TAM6421]